MVKHLIFFIILIPFFLFSGEFTASVNRNQINVGESFTLNLTLKETTAKDPPSFSSLKKSFFIKSQQQFHNTAIINGHATSTTNWRLTLMPQKEGDIQIPPISIETTTGTLFTQPITINVTKGTPTSSTEAYNNKNLLLTSDISNVTPYKNEPFIYTIKLTSKLGLANIKYEKINLEDVILEANGEPKTYKKIIDGISVNVIEFSYLITPLKAGVLKIPSTTIQGSILINHKAPSDSFFNDDLDLFSMMQGFNKLKPFALTTEELILNVQPAIPTVNPWVPAKSFTLKENWNELPSFQVGEPFTRSFEIIAEGVKSSQLPSLNDLQINQGSYKIYADKPVLEDEVREGNIISRRKEQFTIIPQTAGELILPEISIAWWDVNKKERVVARLPSRILDILPSNEKNSDNIATSTNNSINLESTHPINKSPPLFYIVIAGLGTLLFAAVLWGIALQKRIRQLTETSVKKIEDKKENILQKPFDEREKTLLPKNKKDKNEKLPDLNPT